MCYFGEHSLQYARSHGIVKRVVVFSEQPGQVVNGDVYGVPQNDLCMAGCRLQCVQDIQRYDLRKAGCRL